MPGEEWELVGEGYRATDGPAVNGSGRDVLHRSRRTTASTRSASTARSRVFAENTNGANGMMFGPDGRLYAGATRTRQIVAYDAAGQDRGRSPRTCRSTTSRSTSKGDLYFTDTAATGRSGCCRRAARRESWTKGSSRPNGVLFSPDQTLLYVSDYVGQLSWVFQIQPDGSLAHKQRYFYVHMPDAATRSASDGMAVDADGRVYIATALGVQVFDQIGKCHAIIPAPQRDGAVERRVRRPEHRRDVRDQRRQGLQAQDEGQGRGVVASADQAGAAAIVSPASDAPLPTLKDRLGPLLTSAHGARDCRVVRNKTLVCIANYCQPRAAYDIWRSQSLSDIASYYADRSG